MGSGSIYSDLVIAANSWKNHPECNRPGNGWECAPGPRAADMMDLA
jgi:hypothetical protein